jgi:hydrogenase expression/formation protein HypE
MKINLSHGSGGKSTSELVEGIFAKHFSNGILNKMEDAAVLSVGGKIAFSTDSFVVKPVFFPGGDIGKLSVCGTVNDLLMMGAVPKYLSAGFILEEGLDTADLEKIAASMSQAAAEAGVQIVAGDTKVIEGSGGVYINTSGIGEIPEDRIISASRCEDGDVVILSGTLGDHHACILSSRMGIENGIQSDCAVLAPVVNALFDAGVTVKAMRDVTRGGLGTILNEIASSSDCSIELNEEQLPVSEEVNGFCDILGLDPMFMGNEGKMIAVVSGTDAEKAIAAMRSAAYGANATVIGAVTKGKGVILLTRLGGKRVVDVLYGEGLPRIC